MRVQGTSGRDQPCPHAYGGEQNAEREAEKAGAGRLETVEPGHEQDRRAYEKGPCNDVAEAQEMRGQPRRHAPQPINAA